MVKWLFGLFLLSLATACGTAESVSNGQSPFWAGSEDVRGSDALVSFDANATFADVVGAARAVATLRIEGITDVELPKVDRSNVVYVDPSDRERFEQMYEVADSIPTKTTYSGSVESWIKGSGDSKIFVTGMGGVSSYDGESYFPDGFFLLEPGRTYLLLMLKDDQGGYSYFSGREAFDLTSGVRVLNNPITRDLEHFESMSVDDFVSYVKQLATASDSKTD